MAILGPKSNLRLILYSFCCFITVFFYSSILFFYTPLCTTTSNSPHKAQTSLLYEPKPGSAYPVPGFGTVQKLQQKSHPNGWPIIWRPGEDYSGLRPSPLRGRRRQRRRLSARSAGLGSNRRSHPNPRAPNKKPPEWVAYYLAPWRGFEPLTPRLGGACSIL